MGLFNFFKGQLIDVIEWREDSDDVVVYKYPDNDCEIKMGAQLIVRPSQSAIFVSEGRIADVFPAGRYELQTQNMPILSSLMSWKYGFNSPFKCDIYYVNLKQFTDQKWGTSNPVMMRDKEFGMLRIRAYGIYSFRVSDPAKFFTEISGSQPSLTADSIDGYLRRKLVSSFTDMLAESGVAAIDMASQYDELGEKCLKKLQVSFAAIGLTPTDLAIENISLPEEVEKALDTRTKMGVLGDMGKFAQYQTAEAIRDAAQNPGGIAGMGAGIGAGASIGQMMSGAINQMNNQSTATPSAGKVACPNCGASIAAGIKFCPECGKSTQAVCIHCGAPLSSPNAKFCPECGKPQTAVCGKCGAKLVPGAKFCPECGAAQ